MEPDEVVTYSMKVASMVADPRTHILLIYGLYIAGKIEWISRRVGKIEHKLGIVPEPMRRPRLK